ncbi:glycerol kinase GlpK [Abyssibacter profundi]|uniref:Glycerol kinase n=1 Tax=Abyssibacter profundi TaxID=2182787 RepID=A0A383XR98_9GAMM|nr:glycerol kinase GlpK [Abyssibacter profundi]PWN55152.1 glycerol kinase [Abyssibacter profundi]
MSTKLLAIDQGTTSTRAIIFDESGRILESAQTEFEQIYPQGGWVEHDAEVIWSDTVKVCREVLERVGIEASELAGCGITNQRETTVVWDRKTGQPIHNAIVWQDRRTADRCRELREDDTDAWLNARSGLLLDPYFSATKIAWILDHVEGARARAEQGDLAFGTIDSWLIYKLTGGQRHVTDIGNAARTNLFNIVEQRWDPDLLRFFDVPEAMMPKVLESTAEFGVIEPELLGAPVTVGGVAGDQQAATIGQACFSPGMVKNTYGTGCFMVQNIGEQFVQSKNRLLTTVAYRLNGTTTYALEGSIFIAGAAVQWLRDALKIIDAAPDTQALAESLEGNDGVYLVPAFAGLGAPYWDPDARGAVLGLSRGTGIAHFARAALESVSYQTRDLMEAMKADALDAVELRVDGGMVANNWLCQFQADILQLPVVRPQITETTALGAAFLAGLHAGVYDSLDDIAALWGEDRRFRPDASPESVDALYAGWQEAVARVRSE